MSVQISVLLYYNNITGASCAADDLSMNSKCHRKVDSQLTWYNASNDCLYRGGSLAVFTDIGRPSKNRELTTWLNVSGTDTIYWIGLIRSWWKTTSEGEFEFGHNCSIMIFWEQKEMFNGILIDAPDCTTELTVRTINPMKSLETWTSVWSRQQWPMKQRCQEGSSKH